MNLAALFKANPVIILLHSRDRSFRHFCRSFGQKALFGMCPFWNVPICSFWECTLFWICPFLNVPIFECALFWIIFECAHFWMRSFWNGSFLECALFGMHSFWSALFLECTFFWKVPFLECILLNVRQSGKQIMVSSIVPKNEYWHNFQYIDKFGLSKKAAVFWHFYLIGNIRHNFLVPRMIASNPKTFMHIQTPDLHRVSSQFTFKLFNMVSCLHSYTFMPCEVEIFNFLWLVLSTY